MICQGCNYESDLDDFLYCPRCAVIISKEEAEKLIKWLRFEYIPHDKNYKTIVEFIRRLYDLVNENKDD